MKHFLNFLSIAAGAAVGASIYTRFFSNNPDTDWGRAMGVGLCFGIVVTILSKKKSKAVAPPVRHGD